MSQKPSSPGGEVAAAGDRAAPRTVMVMPTYNEAGNIEAIAQRLRSAEPDVDLLIVDDSSPDGTGAIADRLAALDPRVTVLHRQEKNGLGAAYAHGFAVALERGYDLVGEMDADGSHQPEQLRRLLDGITTSDLVIGSRWVPGGSIVNWPLRRQLLSRGGNLYARILLGLDIRDATAGYRLFRREALERVDLDTVVSSGYVFQAELAYRVARAQMRVTEVPIEFVERARGDSKMTAAVALESLVRITRWGSAQRLARVLEHVGGRRRARRGRPPAAHLSRRRGALGRPGPGTGQSPDR